MGAMQRNKGAAYEREIANALNKKLGREAFKRNLVQSREGGYDLSNDMGLAPECKRVERPQYGSWIKQAVEQGEQSGRVPVLITRQNRMPSKYMVILTEDQFCRFVDSKSWMEGL